MANDPYSRPIGATSPNAKLVGEHYGTRATDTARAVAGGNPNAAPAFGIWSTAPYLAPDTTPSPKPTSPNSDATSPTDDDNGVTYEDIFDE